MKQADTLHSTELRVPPEREDFYARCLELLVRSGHPFLLSGTYALSCYTGIIRPTKDVDVFAKPSDALKILAFSSSRACRSRWSTSAGWRASPAASCSWT
jgi:hypothetical protein